MVSRLKVMGHLESGDLASKELWYFFSLLTSLWLGRPCIRGLRVDNVIGGLIPHGRIKIARNLHRSTFAQYTPEGPKVLKKPPERNKNEIHATS